MVVLRQYGYCTVSIAAIIFTYIFITVDEFCKKHSKIGMNFWHQIK
ncbi:hypothetical protein ANACOL_02949 [Anaerotruncus colihominis DSM 17241]|uniref:Uncharacterized protein n=1 Tax=Anaerotruncus colihominis DSM 17241 TaxID=445972 RepID=B0PEF8_9FIRM|nr:hypothetical protein ANACOL_02949 [Anaerotruncus colihominis DSM 17241]